jgi:hypothetical protein
VDQCRYAADLLFRNAAGQQYHTPAWCQSRSRRQQVIPDPYPSSCGKNSLRHASLLPEIAVHKVTVGRARRQLEAEGLIPARGRARPPVWHVPALPTMPEALALGLCVNHPFPGWWTSTDPAERPGARVCAG